jgi:hypothetical protein
MSQDRGGLMLAIVAPVATVVAGVTAAYIGGRFADASARRSVDVQLIAQALSILQQRPGLPSPGLRRWALGVLNKHSDVHMSERDQLALVDSVAFPRSISFSDLLIAQPPFLNVVVSGTTQPKITLDSAGKAFRQRPAPDTTRKKPPQ